MLEWAPEPAKGSDGFWAGRWETGGPWALNAKRLKGSCSQAALKTSKKVEILPLTNDPSSWYISLTGMHSAHSRPQGRTFQAGDIPWLGFCLPWEWSTLGSPSSSSLGGGEETGTSSFRK